MRIISRVLAVVIFGFFMTGTTHAEGNAEAGKAKSTICAGCHGMDGHSSNDLWPNLASQKKGYLVAQIKAFRDGDRTNVIMAPMVTSLSDQDVEDLAAYYSKLK